MSNTATWAEPRPAARALSAPAAEWGSLWDAFGLVDEDLSWQAEALCAQTDPEAFYPEKGGATRPAKAVCAACPVAAQCLEYALAHDERFGIWGGKSERERRRIRDARKQQNETVGS